MKLIAEGAEAQILKIDNKTLKKIRLEKPYRLKEIDKKLRKSRNRREFKVLNKLQEIGINAPKPYELFEKDEIFFTFEFLDGNILKEVLNLNFLKKAFNQIIKLHQNNITHKDLTTLNMIEKNNEIYLIDFGLSDFSHKIEDRAVDLNLFFMCIKNEHPNFYKYKKELLSDYKNKIEKGEEIIKRLEKVENRGRNK